MPSCAAAPAFRPREHRVQSCCWLSTWPAVLGCIGSACAAGLVSGRTSSRLCQAAHLQPCCHLSCLAPGILGWLVNQAPDPTKRLQAATLTAPAPRALIWLSPEPGATTTSGDSPSSSAISGLSLPTVCTSAWLCEPSRSRPFKTGLQCTVAPLAIGGQPLLQPCTVRIPGKV